MFEPGLVGHIAWLVPLLPFLAFFVILFFGKRLPDKGHSVGIGAVAIGLVISLLAFIELAGGRGDIEKSWTWFEFPGILELEFGMKYRFPHHSDVRSRMHDLPLGADLLDRLHARG